MKRLTENIWWMDPVSSTDRPVLALIKGTRRTLMVDGANCPNHARQFLEEARLQGLPAPDFIAITHSHCDHVFGLSALAGILVTNRVTAGHIARMNALGWDDAAVSERVRRGEEHEMTAAMLKSEMPGDRTGFRIRDPDLVYDARLEVDLGGTVCHLEWISGDHARDSTLVFVPGDQVVFLGDCLYLRDRRSEVVDDLVKKLLSFDATVFIDSHLDRPIARRQIEKRDPSLFD